LKIMEYLNIPRWLPHCWKIQLWFYHN